MKKIFLFCVLSLFLSELIACDCANVRFDEAFRRSSHVASGKVLEISTYEIDPTLLKVKFETYEEFKGSGLNEFYITDPQKADGICHINLKKGQELLVYLSSIDGGLPSFGYCSRYFPLTSLKSHPPEIEILRSLKGINYTSTFFIDTYKNEFFNHINQIESSSLIPHFGIFEVEIDHLNFWTESKVINGFNNELDDKILALINKSDWIIDNYNSDANPPSLAKFILVITNRYYEGSKSYHLDYY